VAPTCPPGWKQGPCVAGSSPTASCRRRSADCTHARSEYQPHSQARRYLLNMMTTPLREIQMAT
jgi:hypothetical protein